MKAIVCTKYGFPRPIQLKEVEKPFPADNEVLVENHASCVNYNNQLLVRGKFLPFRLLMGSRLLSKSCIPGTNMAGRVEAVGKSVRLFKPGDDVYGDLLGNGQGCFAEHICAPENVIALKPPNLSYEEAASISGQCARRSKSFQSDYRSNGTARSSCCHLITFIDNPRYR